MKQIVRVVRGGCAAVSVLVGIVAVLRVAAPTPARPLPERSGPPDPQVRAHAPACCPTCDTEWVAVVDDDECWMCGHVGFAGGLDEYCRHLVRGGVSHASHPCAVCAPRAGRATPAVELKA